MNADELLSTLRQHGVELTLDGDRVRYRAPKGVLTDNLRDAMCRCKPALLDLLCPQGSPAARTANSPYIGRHGAPCPQCADTWQWPTVGGFWVCSWCFVGDPRTAPRFADDGTLLGACDR